MDYKNSQILAAVVSEWARPAISQIAAGNLMRLPMLQSLQYLDGKIRQLENKVDANKDAQQAVNAQQMAYNAAANANIDVLKSQVASLLNVTKMMIPSGNVCQMGCGCACNQ